MNVQYEYLVKTSGGSSFDTLEGVGEHLQDSLMSEGILGEVANGWELWQVSVLQERVYGQVFIFRRPK